MSTSAGAKLLSAFTPSNMSHADLEAIFVRREPLMERLLRDIRDSVTTPAKRHALLIGPRGIGKTHLVSLVYYRVRGDVELDTRVRVAWLEEEGYGIASYLDLLRSILKTLADEYRDSTLRAAEEQLSRRDEEDARAEAERLLLDFLGDRTLLLLMENLERRFDALEEIGQRQFRAFLQNHRNTVVLATTPGLFAAVSLQESPFYNFFAVTHLDELTEDDALTLFEKIAELRGDADLAAFLKTDTARARIRAVALLAGGHPRIWILFAGYITRDMLDELVPLFMKMLDELTPYYQSRMDQLPQQQRKIVAFLCERRYAVSVKAIARECRFATPQVASVQLQRLREIGYVRPETAGRESFYELREPLMRLAIEVKKSRGRPLRLIVDFLRRWYTLDELYKRLVMLPSHFLLDRDYLVEAMRLSIPRQERADIVSSLLSCMKRGDLSKGLELCAHVVFKLDEDSSASEYLLKGYFLFMNNMMQESLDAFEMAVSIDNSHYLHWFLRGLSLMSMSSPEDALMSFEKSVELIGIGNDDYSYKGFVLTSAGLSALAIGEYKLSLQRLTDALNVNPNDIGAKFGMAESLLGLGSWEDFLVHLAEAFRSKNKNSGISWYGSTQHICSVLISQIRSVPPVYERIESLVDIYSLNSATALLGKGVTVSIPNLFTFTVSDDEAQEWLSAWQNAAQGHEELEIPVRLLEAGVRWRKTRDRRILLGLPIEERRILESLLPEDEPAKNGEAPPMTQVSDARARKRERRNVKS